MSRTTFGLVALLSLVGSSAMAQGHGNGSVRILNPGTLNQYTYTPAINYPAYQQSQIPNYFANPSLRFNNPVTQAGSFQSAVGGNIPMGFTPPASGYTTPGSVAANPTFLTGTATNAPAMTSAPASFSGAASSTGGNSNAANVLNGLVGANRSRNGYNGSVGFSNGFVSGAVSGGYGGYNVAPGGWGGYGWDGFNVGSGGVQGSLNPAMLNGTLGFPQTNGTNGAVDSRGSLIGGTETDPDAVSTLNGTAKSKSRAKKAASKKKSTSKPRKP